MTITVASGKDVSGKIGVPSGIIINRADIGDKIEDRIVRNKKG